MAADLLSLSSHLLGSLWPLERLFLGLCVCKRLYEDLPPSMPRVKLILKEVDTRQSERRLVEFPQRINSFLARINGNVEVVWPTGCSMYDCGESMRGKVDDLSVYVQGGHPSFSFLEMHADTVKLCMPSLRRLSLDGRNRDSREGSETKINLERILANLDDGCCSKLETLRIAAVDFFEGVWNTILPKVARVVTLRSLHLDMARFTSAGGGLGNLLGGLSALEKLHLSRVVIMPWGLFRKDRDRALLPLPPLTELTLEKMTIPISEFGHFCEMVGRLSTLKVLRLNRLDDRANEYEATKFDLKKMGMQVCRLPLLTELDMNEFSGCVRAMEDLEPWLGRCTELRVLKLQALCLTFREVVDLLRMLAPCSKLEEMDITGNIRTIDTLKAREFVTALVGNLPSLKRFWMMEKLEGGYVVADERELLEMGNWSVRFVDEEAVEVFLNMLREANVVYGVSWWI
eukprot:123463-Rhodomonas_salina.2